MTKVTELALYPPSIPFFYCHFGLLIILAFISSSISKGKMALSQHKTKSLNLSFQIKLNWTMNISLFVCFIFHLLYKISNFWMTNQYWIYLVFFKWDNCTFFKYGAYRNIRHIAFLLHDVWGKSQSRESYNTIILSLLASVWVNK